MSCVQCRIALNCDLEWQVCLVWTSIEFYTVRHFVIKTNVFFFFFHSFLLRFMWHKKSIKSKLSLLFTEDFSIFDAQKNRFSLAHDQHFKCCVVVTESSLQMANETWCIAIELIKRTPWESITKWTFHMEIYYMMKNGHSLESKKKKTQTKRDNRRGEEKVKMWLKC